MAKKTACMLLVYSKIAEIYTNMRDEGKANIYIFAMINNYFFFSTCHCTYKSKLTSMSHYFSQLTYSFLNDQRIDLEKSSLCFLFLIKSQYIYHEETEMKVQVIYSRIMRLCLDVWQHLYF